MVARFNFESLFIAAKTISIDKEDSYIQSYPEFIEYFRKLKIIEKQNLIIGAHFVYGWMPTILKLNTDNIKRILLLLNTARDKDQLSLEELEFLKGTINNSMVGLSKLLHFINPENYAIWDSRIYGYLYNQEPYDYRIGKIKLYQEYLDEVIEFTEYKSYSSFHSIVEKKLNYKVSAMRAVEIVMFEAFKNRS